MIRLLFPKWKILGVDAGDTHTRACSSRPDPRVNSPNRRFGATTHAGCGASDNQRNALRTTGAACFNQVLSQTESYCTGSNTSIAHHVEAKTGFILAILTRYGFTGDRRLIQQGCRQRSATYLSSVNKAKRAKSLAPQVGFEPTTLRLTAEQVGEGLAL